MTNEQRRQVRRKQDQQDAGGNRALTISPERCRELNICPRCNGDLGETALRPTDGILGAYSPCRCPRVVVDNMSSKELVPMSENELAKPFEGKVQEMRNLVVQLQQMPTGLQKASVAKEAIDEAKQYLRMLDCSDLAKATTETHQAHKRLVRMMKLLSDPADTLIKACQRAQIEYENMRKAKEEAERREREAAAMAAAEAQRAAEAEHLKSLGHTKEAEELVATPLEPVSLPEEKNPVGKIAGVSVTDVWVPDDDPIENGKLFFEYLANHPMLWAGVELKPMFWKTLLSQNKGNLKVPGLKVVKKQETRSR